MEVVKTSDSGSIFSVHLPLVDHREACMVRVPTYSLNSPPDNNYLKIANAE